MTVLWRFYAARMHERTAIALSSSHSDVTSARRWPSEKNTSPNWSVFRLKRIGRGFPRGREYDATLDTGRRQQGLVEINETKIPAIDPGIVSSPRMHHPALGASNRNSNWRQAGELDPLGFNPSRDYASC